MCIRMLLIGCLCLVPYRIVPKTPFCTKQPPIKEFLVGPLSKSSHQDRHSKLSFLRVQLICVGDVGTNFNHLTIKGDFFKRQQ